MCAVRLCGLNVALIIYAMQVREHAGQSDLQKLQADSHHDQRHRSGLWIQLLAQFIPQKNAFVQLFGTQVLAQVRVPTSCSSHSSYFLLKS